MSKPVIIPVAAAPAKLSIRLPDAERGWSEGQIARFDRLKRKLARTDLKPRQRQEAEDELTTLLGSPKAAEEREALERSLAQTAALAHHRGEQVSVNPKTGQVQVLSRGGLKQAYQDGHLQPEHGPLTSDDLYDAAKRYRDAFEIVEGLATNDKGGAGGFGPKAPQPRLMEAGRELALMRDALTDRQQDVLDLVCGQDVRLRLAATQLRRGFHGCRNSLRGGLSVLAELKIERVKVAEVLRMKTGAIVAAQNAA